MPNVFVHRCKRGVQGRLASHLLARAVAMEGRFIRGRWEAGKERSTKLRSSKFQIGGHEHAVARILGRGIRNRRARSRRGLLRRALYCEFGSEHRPLEQDGLATGLGLLSLLVARQSVNLQGAGPWNRVLGRHIHAAGDGDLLLVAGNAELLAVGGRRPAAAQFPRLDDDYCRAKGRDKLHHITVDQNEIGHDCQASLASLR